MKFVIVTLALSLAVWSLFVGVSGPSRTSYIHWQRGAIVSLLISEPRTIEGYVVGIPYAGWIARNHRSSYTVGSYATRAEAELQLREPRLLRRDWACLV
jgi:hypothetical protein